MNTYKVYETIEKLIENSVVEYETGRKVIRDAFNKGKIEKWQYEELVELANKYL